MAPPRPCVKCVCAGNWIAALTMADSWAPFWSASILLDCCFAAASSLAFSISSLTWHYIDTLHHRHSYTGYRNKSSSSFILFCTWCFVHVVFNKIHLIDWAFNPKCVCVDSMCLYIPLHSFLQLFDGGIRSCWGGQRLLVFLKSSGEFLFPFIQTALKTVNTSLSLHTLVLAFLQLHDRDKASPHQQCTGWKLLLLMTNCLIT